jgi:hypothetical protein
MKKDGTSISGAFAAEQSVTLLTSSGETSIKLSDLKWMAGSEVWKLRVSGMKTLLSGTLRETELTIQRMDKDKKKPTSIPTAEIVFVFGGEVDLNKTSELRIDEYGGDMRVLFYSNPKRKAKLEVTLIPENWNGGIQIMNPSYREKMSNREEFTIDMMLQADALTKANLEKMTSDPKAERLMITMNYIFEGGNSLASSPLDLKLERDNTASVEKYRQALRQSLGKPFYMEMNGQVLQDASGSGYFNLYIDTGRERLADGQLQITKTLSNVFHLPITLEKR